jgi:ATP-dependent RNA helicase DeaD
VNEPAAVESSAAPEQERPEPPRPTFDLLPLSDEVRATLAEMGYVHPTPVQLAVWEPATRGKDAVVQARTGTGKTASFGLPLVDHVVKRSIEGVQVARLCPTRELAVQVAPRSSASQALQGHQVDRHLRRRPDAAPDRRRSPRARRSSAARPAASSITSGAAPSTRTSASLVLDESDEMLSMGFERELTPSSSPPGEPADAALLRDRPAGHRAHRARTR